MVKVRMTRSERKKEILRVLRDNSAEGGSPLTCRKIAQRMGMRGYGYINQLLLELCDDDMICVDVKASNKAISNIRFEYYV